MNPPFAPGAAEAVVSAVEALNRALDQALAQGWLVAVALEETHVEIPARAGGWPTGMQATRVSATINRKVGP